MGKHVRRLCPSNSSQPTQSPHPNLFINSSLAAWQQAGKELKLLRVAEFGQCLDHRLSDVDVGRLFVKLHQSSSRRSCIQMTETDYCVLLSVGFITETGDQVLKESGCHFGDSLLGIVPIDRISVVRRCDQWCVRSLQLFFTSRSHFDRHSMRKFTSRNRAVQVMFLFLRSVILPIDRHLSRSFDRVIAWSQPVPLQQQPQRSGFADLETGWVIYADTDSAAHPRASKSGRRPRTHPGDAYFNVRIATTSICDQIIANVLDLEQNHNRFTN